MIKVGIECESIEESQTWGVARQINKLLEQLAQRPELASQFKFFLYFKSRIPDYPYLASPLFEKKLIRLPFIPSSFSLYYYLYLPIRLWFEGLAVMYFPNYMLPLLFRGRSLVTLTEDVFYEMQKQPRRSGRGPDIKSSGLPFRYRLAYWIFSGWAARRATKIMAISETSKQILTEVFKIKSERIVVNSPGIDFPKTPITYNPKPPTLRSGPRHEIVGAETYLLYVAQAFPRRHLRETILAFNKISPEFPDLKLIAIGKDKYNPPIIAAMLNDRIIHRDYISEAELSELYASAKALVYVSDREAFGLPPMEALAYGTPAIVADQPITRELFGDNAFYVLTTYDVTRLVDNIAVAMRQALTDEVKRQQIAKAAPAIVSRYTWPGHTDRWLEIVRQISAR